MGIFAFQLATLGIKHTYPAQRIPFYIFFPLDIRFFFVLFCFCSTQIAHPLLVFFSCFLCENTNTRFSISIYYFFVVSKSFLFRSRRNTGAIIAPASFSRSREKQKKEGRKHKKKPRWRMDSCNREDVCDVMRIGDDAIRRATNCGLRPRILFSTFFFKLVFA